MTNITGMQTGTHNNHPAPPRLFPLIWYVRSTTMWMFADIAGVPGVQPRDVTCPAHVVTGSLRRGDLQGVVHALIEGEQGEVRRRQEVAKKVLAMRPPQTPYEEWAEWLAAMLREGVALEEIERRARAEADRMQFAIPKLDPVELADRVTVYDAGVLNQEATDEVRAQLREASQ